MKRSALWALCPPGTVTAPLPRHAPRDRVVGRAGDGGDDLLLGGGGDVEEPVVAAQAQHRDPVRDGLDVAQVVADQQHPEPAFTEPFHQVEDLGGLLDAEGGGGLVQHHQARFAEQRPGDGDGLPLASGEGRDGPADVGDADGEGGQQIAGAALHLHLVQDADPGDLTAEEEIADDVEVVAEREVLVDGGDPQVLGVVRAADVEGAALPFEGARVGRFDARDHLDQGGLPRAVVAHQGDDLTGVDLQLDVRERLDRAEALEDATQRQQGRGRQLGHPRLPSFRVVSFRVVR
ncbi:hypothetical protein SVIO_082490 [Streptomyces violaceusniger]|uniref:Uncharacterized protein n=1 Tax=Streptomyces violaceusniger TaxID=68280 RepID=A0A4D4LEH2_STRVO|nr:hypothetical protein SVIO_082490 [Streptomyces violaceusniger]